MLLLILMVFAYLLGSVSVAIVACRLMGLPDPRTEGSGNPGATNVLRMAGKKLAIVVLIGDALKGAVAVLIAILLGIAPDLLGWVALAVFLGHLFPVFFQFRGGKGVATAAGAILMLSWPLGLLVLGTWIAVAALFRYSSLAALIASILTPVYGYWFLSGQTYITIILMVILLVWRHRSNIEKLWKGEEGKIGDKPEIL